MGVTFSLIDNATAPARSIRNSFMGLDQAVGHASNVINNSLGAITGGFMALALTAGALLGPFAAATKANMEFESTISAVGAKARASEKEISMLREQALELGMATKFSAKEVAEGQEFLAMAGFNVRQNMEAMPGLLNLAAAANMGLARASDIASNVLTQFRLEASDMTKVADIMALTVNSANTNMEQMAQAMKFFGPTAASFGISLEEASATIGLLGNAGLQGSIATRALGTSLARLTKPTKQMQILMDEMGFSAFDAKGNFIGMANMIEMLESKTKGFTQEQRMSAITTLFGTEAIQEISSLLSTKYVKGMDDGTEATYYGAEALKEYTKTLESSAGAAERIAKKMLDNLKGDITIFQGVFDTMMIVVGGALAPALRPVVQMTTELVKDIKTFAGTKLGQWAIQAAAGLGTLAVGLMAVSFVFGILIPMVWNMVVAVGALLIELAPIIAAIAILVGAFMLIRKAVSMFNDVLAGAEAKTGFLGFMQKVGAVIMGTIDIFRSWNGETFALSEEMHDSLQRIGMLEFMLDLGTWIVRIKEFMKGFVEGASMFFEAFKVIWEVAKQSFNELFDALESLGIVIGSNESALSGWAKAGKIVGFVMTEYILRPISFLLMVFSLLAKAISFVIRNLENLLMFIPGLGQLVMLKNLLGIGEDGEEGNTSPWDSKNYNKIRNNTSASPWDASNLNRLKHQSNAGSNTSTDEIGDLIAQANAMKQVTEKVIERNSETKYKNITLVNQMDGKEISRQVFEEEEIEDSRN